MGGLTPQERGARASAIVSRLSREEKIGLLSGADFWHTRALPQHGIGAVHLSDGPHGLRVQDGAVDHVGQAASAPATCFPTAVTLASAWDPDLIAEVGAALAREARALGVGVVLGPGMNIKRHPGGGRSFEYFSEDPFLTGECATAMVRGIQSEGVGACVKHFAVNNQESNRMRLDTIVDPRTLRELYLAGFETAVTRAEPWAVMSAYNLVNGEHAGESRTLLADILRGEWGFDGLVVSDWFAVADRPAGVRAGLDLEMPSSSGAWDARVAAALDAGTVTPAELDAACARVVGLALRVAEGRDAAGNTPLDRDANHALARRAAAAGTVLLTNDGVLPLAGEAKVALIGAFAETPRYQGAGSSLVNPTRLDSLLDALRERRGTDLAWAPGYDPVTGATSVDLLAEARAAAASADVVVLVVGLPARAESEGYDRPHLRLPVGQETLVQVVTDANPRTVVVLVNGAPVELGWADRPAALVEAYLGGQAGGSALADVLYGDAEPGGRLAESFPVAGEELPASANFSAHPTQVQYREGLWVGYRFHDTFGVAPRFCFGHGLGYTSFAWSDLAVEGDGTDLTVSVTVTNTGHRAGAEVVQLYVHDVASTLHRPAQELKGFARIRLEPGESGRVSIGLDRRSFAVYDVATSAWLVEAGEYELRVGASSRDLRASTIVEIPSDDVVTPVVAPEGPIATDAEFAALLGRPVPAAPPLWPLTEDSAIGDLRQTWLGRRLYALVNVVAGRRLALDEGDANSPMMEAALAEMPLRGTVAYAGGRFSFAHLRAALAVLNRATLRRPR
ncbi:MAG: glycoside hydrolase family 3 C-terminal domain-containing protein [Propionicimonas sp.]|uniref:beta-glucosidase family protein n=1 Tax=Propionicimonas sp. TaxID=1955623 RepID=UPI003D13A30F